MGIGFGTWTTAIVTTLIGFTLADFLNKDIIIGLAIVNPVYFFCMMIGAMNNLKISLAIILGTILGPVFYLFSSEWAILFAGLTAGSISYLFGVRDGSK